MKLLTKIFGHFPGFPAVQCFGDDSYVFNGSRPALPKGNVVVEFIVAAVWMLAFIRRVRVKRIHKFIPSQHLYLHGNMPGAPTLGRFKFLGGLYPQKETGRDDGRNESTTPFLVRFNSEAKSEKKEKQHPTYAPHFVISESQRNGLRGNDAANYAAA